MPQLRIVDDRIDFSQDQHFKTPATLINSNLLEISVIKINLDGKIIFNNQKAEQILGKSLSGNNLDSLVEFKNKNNSTIKFIKSTLKSGFLIKKNIRFLSKFNGKEAFVDISSTPIFDDNGKIEGITFLLKNSNSVAEEVPIYNGSADSDILVRAIIVSHSPIMRSGITQKLKNFFKNTRIFHIKDFEISSLLECFAVNRPNLILIDTSLRSKEHINYISRIRSYLKKCKIITITDKADCEAEYSMFVNGADGIIDIKKDYRDFKSCVFSVLNDEYFVKNKLLKKYVKKTKPLLQLSKNKNKIFSKLRPKEIDIVSLVARGYKNKEIAQKLFLSEKTVKVYLTKIYKKLNIRSRKEVLDLLSDF